MADWHDVKSSNVEAYAHDPETGDLQVRYKGGAIYRYANVPPETVEGLAAAESVGSYIAANIKGRHEATKLPPPDDEVTSDT